MLYIILILKILKNLLAHWSLLLLCGIKCKFQHSILHYPARLQGTHGGLPSPLFVTKRGSFNGFFCVAPYMANGPLRPCFLIYFPKLLPESFDDTLLHTSLIRCDWWCGLFQTVCRTELLFQTLPDWETDVSLRVAKILSCFQYVLWFLD